jgi:hypothetical protein
MLYMMHWGSAMLAIACAEFAGGWFSLPWIVARFAGSPIRNRIISQASSTFSKVTVITAVPTARPLKKTRGGFAFHEVPDKIRATPSAR